MGAATTSGAAGVAVGVATGVALGALGVDEAHIAKGIVRHDDRLTILLDFDKIIAQLQPELLSDEEKAKLLGEE